MDPLYLAYYLSLFLMPLLFYLVASRKKNNSPYSRPTWYYTVKRLFAVPSVKRFRDDWRYATKYLSDMDRELPQSQTTEYESDGYVIYAADNGGNYFSCALRFGHTSHMDVSIEFRSSCGKVYRLPDDHLVQRYSARSRQWKAGGLNVEVLDPLRRLRITYRGIMRCTSSGNRKGQLEYVRFSFFWSAGSEPVFHPQDANLDLLTDSLAREPWRDGEWIQMLGNDCGFEQYGVLQGHLSSSSSDETFLYMPSWRRRRWGPSDVLAVNRDFNVFGTIRDGTVFCVGARSLRLGATQLRYGTILMSNGSVRSISGCDISLGDLADNMEVPNAFTVHFKVDGKTFKCVSHVNTSRASTAVSNEERGWIATTTNVECDVNNEQARGIVMFWYKRNGDAITLPPPLLVPQKSENVEKIFVAPLATRECLDLSLTGGKGNSLGLLLTTNSSEFAIPPGFVVTSNSLRRHLQQNPNLAEHLQQLRDVCGGAIDANLEETCKRTVELFTRTPIDDTLAKCIRDETVVSEGAENGDCGWAVRSSAIGEDSDELSAAGQNSTFLGCRTPDDVLKAVQACWGSLFSFQSVEYRRQHGLEIQCGMAVVIQRMVPADCAGVLFTSHPATGDPSQMVITSNYGLGESVVSASADPDTFTLAKSIKGNIKILCSNVGTKKTQISLGPTRDDGTVGTTEERAVDDGLSQELSITEEQVIELGKLGVFLEGAFGSPQDIEWAFHKGKLYLLQSRPITTLDAWTNWELQHEFDSPIMSANSLYTRANVGEVIKGAVTPLSQSFTVQILDSVLQRATGNGKHSNYHRKCLVTSSHFVFMDVINFLYSNITEKIALENTVADLAVFGRGILDETILKTALARHGPMGVRQKLRFYATQLEKVTNNKAAVREASGIVDIWKIKIRDYETPKAVLDRIDFTLDTLRIASSYHADTSRTSVIYQMVAMVVLAEKHAAFNADHYHDVGLLLAANDDVESAEIPVVLEGIADAVRKGNLAGEFVRIRPEDGMKWFAEKLPKCKERLDRFFKVHGHRAFREFELFEKTWDMQPEMVIAMLQSNCIRETTTKKAAALSVEETISKLISPSRNITRKILKFIVKRCRVAVAARETTKSVVIKMVHRFRVAFNELGRRMVRYGYIPHQDLVFFLTIEELRSHLTQRNPTLVSKAVRRWKLYATWNSLRFPELCYGVPRPERADEAEFARTEGGPRVRGTPVCRGNVVGRACVITDIGDVNRIEPGDVLITVSTDVAWSPYFPILSGIVTEIGGLISHGAVVAREYGLPCVVGAQNVTKHFKTGDKVLLDGKAGVVELVE